MPETMSPKRLAHDDSPPVDPGGQYPQCPQCSGRGMVRMELLCDDEVLYETIEIPCTLCCGEGRTTLTTCKLCGRGPETRYLMVEGEDGAAVHVSHSGAEHLEPSLALGKIL